MAQMPSAGSSGAAASGVARSRFVRAALGALVAASLWLCAPAGASATQSARLGAGTSTERAVLRALERDHLAKSGGSGAAAGGSAGAPSSGAASGSPAVGTAGAAGAAGGSTAATAPPATTTTSTTATASTVAPAAATSSGAAPSAHGGSGTSTPAIVLAAIAAVLVLLSLGWALARAFAYEPSWMPALRHSFAEAGFRVSATFAELGDWLRLGR